MLALHKKFSMNMGHEQATPRQAHPNPRHAMRRIVDAVDQPRCRCIDQHSFQATG